MCLSPSGYKLQSRNFANLFFARLSIKLRAQVLNFLEFAKEFSWKILKFSSKTIKNGSKSVWVQARELKFCMNMLCLFEYEIAYSNLQFFEMQLSGFLKNPDIFLKNVKNVLKS
jgi:hypothetical protein